MPVIYTKLRFGSQQGYNDTGALFTNGGYNYGCKTDRVHIFRFSHVDVPKGSTINSATLYVAYSGKNASGTAYTLNQTVWTDQYSALTPWLDTTRNEWNGGFRNWTNHSGGSSTFNWIQGGPSRQIHPHNVQAHITAATSHANWTLAGGSLSFLIGYNSVSNPDNIYLHTHADGFSPILEINYTPPVSDGKESVVNIQENGQFTRSTDSAGAFNMAPMGFNAWFGSFVQPNYSIISTFTTNPPAPPHGGNALRIEPTTGRPMVHFGIPTLDDGEWYNLSAYVFMPTSTPAGMELSMTSLGDKNGTVEDNGTTTKGSWVRINQDFLADTLNPNWTSLQGSGSVTWNAAATFYVANVQLTKGRRQRPYIAGNLSLTNATYGWAGADVNGFVRAPAPTVTVAAQVDKARRKYYGVDWTYSNSAGHAQVNAEVKVRRVT